MQEKENNITKQNKLIIAGLLASTFLIVGFGIYTSFNIQDNLKNNYRSYSEVMAKTLANLSESNIKTEYLQEKHRSPWINYIGYSAFGGIL